MKFGNFVANTNQCKSWYTASVPMKVSEIVPFHQEFLTSECDVKNYSIEFPE